MFILNGKRLQVWAPFDAEVIVKRPDDSTYLDKMQFPGGWLISASPEELLWAGIEIQPDPVMPDTKFHDVTQNDDGSYVSSLKPRDVVQNIVWGLIQTTRDLIQESGFRVNGVWFQSDSKSRGLYPYLAQAAQNQLLLFPDSTQPLIINGSVLEWKILNNTTLIMTPMWAKDIVRTLFEFDCSTFAIAESHKQIMLGVSSPENYDYTVGWPQLAPGVILP